MSTMNALLPNNIKEPIKGYDEESVGVGVLLSVHGESQIMSAIQTQRDSPATFFREKYFDVQFICKVVENIEKIYNETRDFCNNNAAFHSGFEGKAGKLDTVDSISCFACVFHENYMEAYQFSSISFSNANSGSGGVSLGTVGINATLLALLSISAFKWLHINSLQSLEVISQECNMHPVFLDTFHDARSHSCFIRSDDSFMITLCHTVVNPTGDACQYKFYLYVQTRTIITFELGLKGYGVYDNISKKGDKNELMKFYTRLGPMVLIRDLIKTALSLQNSAMVACAQYVIMNRDYLFFTNTLRQSEYASLTKNIRQSQVCLQLLRRLLENSHRVVSKLDNDHIAGIIQPNTDINPYISSLVDEYSFHLEFVKNEITDCESVYNDIQNITNQRQSRTSVILALVATLFLPLTFLTGVFGMNFQRNGDYSIELLNDSNGPTYFIIMSCGLGLLIISYYITNGWITFVFAPRRIRLYCTWLTNIFMQCYLFWKPHVKTSQDRTSLINFPTLSDISTKKNVLLITTRPYSKRVNNARKLA